MTENIKRTPIRWLNNEKLISLLLSVFLLFGAEQSAMSAFAATNREQRYHDVPKSHWAFENIAEMSERGVLNGYPDGNFYPESKVTRAEFAKIMTLAASVPVTHPAANPYADIDKDAWHAPYIQAAKPYMNYYLSGGLSVFRPDSPALREDIAVALVRLKGYSVMTADETVLTHMFSDATSISANAKKYIAVAVERGLIVGYEDGTFRGQQSITRAEAAALLFRAYQFGDDNKIIEDDTPSGKPAGDTLSMPDKTTDKENTEEKKDNQEQKKSDNDDPDKVDAPKKPFVLQKLASARIKDDNAVDFADLDGKDMLYYYDEDGCVYRVDTKSGKKTAVLNVGNLTFTLREEREIEEIEEITELEETGEYREVEEEIVEEVPIEDEPEDDPEGKIEDETEDESRDKTEDGPEDDPEGKIEDEAEDESKDKTEDEPKVDLEGKTEDQSDEDGEEESAGLLEADGKKTKTVTRIVVKKVPVMKEVTRLERKTVKKNVTVGKYSDFAVTQVFYDTTNKRMLLIGFYRNYKDELDDKNSFKDDTKGKDGTVFIYDISEGDTDLVMRFKPEISGSYHGPSSEGSHHTVDNHYYSYSYRLLLFLDKTTMLHWYDGGDRFESYNITKFDSSDDSKASLGIYTYDGLSFFFIRQGNDLYYLKYGLYNVVDGYAYCICKYSFNEDTGKRLLDDIRYIKRFIFCTNSTSHYYSYDKYNGKIFKYDVRTQKESELVINTTDKDLEITDFGTLNNFAPRFFIVDEVNIIFYDKALKSFRLLTRNR